jgi:hypothetical protein
MVMTSAVAGVSSEFRTTCVETGRFVAFNARMQSCKACFSRQSIMTKFQIGMDSRGISIRAVADSPAQILQCLGCFSQSPVLSQNLTWLAIVPI